MKRIVGKYKNKVLVEGDINSISANEVLVVHDSGYTVLRIKTAQGIETLVVVPLKEFENARNK